MSSAICEVSRSTSSLDFANAMVNWLWASTPNEAAWWACASVASALLCLALICSVELVASSVEATACAS